MHFNPFTLKPDFSYKPNMAKIMFKNFNSRFFAYKTDIFKLNNFKTKTRKMSEAERSREEGRGHFFLDRQTLWFIGK